jgi:exopolysaccharide biosynthesis polyprenyl glycosylphosphotransferase
MDSVVYNYDYEPEAGGNEAVDHFVPRSAAARRTEVLRRLLLTADVCAALLSGAFTAFVFGLSVTEGARLAFTLIALTILLAFFFGLYSDSDLLTWASGLADATGVQPETWVAVVATTTLATSDSLGRALARGWAHRIAPLRQRTLIVGSGLVADRLADRLARHTEFGLQAIGLVDDDVHTLASSKTLPTLGTLDELGDVLVDRKVDRVIIAFSRASHQQLLSCIRSCRDKRVAVDIVPRLFELLDGAQALTQIGGLPVFSIGAPPLTRTSRLAKRLLDVVVASGVLIVLSPLLLATAIAIKVDSRGPVFFRQVRAGRGDTRFRLIKFRSMYKDADERKRAFEDQNESDDGVMFKIRRDPRITKVGGFLRRSSLDEIPQLINVLKGEMSLVGPRPLILSEAAEAAKSWHARRLDLRPGITGLWQVSGRSDLPFQEMVRFDYQYVSGWSLARDVEILLATIPVVLSGRGAY